MKYYLYNGNDERSRRHLLVSANQTGSISGLYVSVQSWYTWLILLNFGIGSKYYTGKLRLCLQLL